MVLHERQVSLYIDERPQDMSGISHHVVPCARLFIDLARVLTAALREGCW